MIFGLIGFPLSHSFSKQYFNQKFANEGLLTYQYEVYPIEDVLEMHSLWENNPRLRGLNVTIPHKQSVIALLDELDEPVRAIGAVNCIKNVTGKLRGYNTDVYGFEESLKSFLEVPFEGKALILGTGGAAKAVQYVLKKNNIPYQSISRNTSENGINYQEINEEMMATHRLIINTTPLGMYPNIEGKPPIPYHLLSAEHYLFDLVYNPTITAFMQAGSEQGAKVQNGLDMLHLQAEKAWEIWMND